MKETRLLKVLAVDDDPKTLNLIGIMLGNYGYNFKTVAGGQEALDVMTEYAPDLVLLDEEMPGLDGVETCKKIKQNPFTKNIAVILLTDSMDRNSRLVGLAAGADDFLRKPLDDTEVMVSARNVLRLKELDEFAKSYSETLESEIEEKVQQLIAGEIETILKLTSVAEFHDEQTSDHIIRVGKYSQLIAKSLGWSKGDQETLLHAATMHDIGKVGIPLQLLLKPTRLTPEEFALIKAHTTIGAQLLQGSVSKYLQMAEVIALSHHERWDGSGYPHGLKGEEIPEAARIVCVADQYDALRSKRAFRESLDHATVANIIIEGDGRTMPEHFDPRVLKAFIELSSEFDNIFHESAE